MNTSDLSDLSDFEQRLNYLEEQADFLKMQNLVLATAFKTMLKSMPSDIAQDMFENIRMAFDDEIARLEYEDANNVELFHDITYEFFSERN